ncbi:MAG TPA: PKD domain-containing protein [Chitinophagaceae bacterium]|nr:PKD domain-containing protein [Chitinophagaceae bacterium]
MKKLFYSFLTVLLFLQYSSRAQTNICIGLANFEYVIDGSTVKFSSLPTTSDTPRHHQWRFGDGSTSDDVNPIHTYAAGGTYRVVHYVKDSIRNCYDSLVKEITISNVSVCPKPKFEWKKDSINPKLIRFYNATGPLPTNYKFTWQFGDGSSSTELNPTHLYQDTGIYNACLIVERLNDSSCRNYSCQSIYLTPYYCKINPDFTWELLTDSSGTKVYFKNTSLPTISSNVKFSWGFGDGTYSNEVHPQHSYNKPGTYRVCLRMQVLNTDCIKEICKEIVVPSSCTSLGAKFEWRTDSLHPLRGIQFINLSSTLPGTQPKVRWNFGDGSESNEWSPFHQYANPGEYNVCLKVAWGNDCVKEICKKLIILNPNNENNCEEISKFKFERTTDNVLGFRFSAIHYNANWKYVWTFGDGQGALGNEVNHSYQRPGKYKVCLTVYKSDECASTTCIEVVVGRIPCDELQLKSEYVKNLEIPNRVKFIAVTNTQLTNVKWVIYKSNASNSNPVILFGAESVYTFNEKGLYKVCLFASTVNGCYKQYCDTLRIDNVVTPAECLLQIYPNPATKYIEFDVKSETSGLLVVNIYDINGVRRTQFLATGQQGDNHLRFPIEVLPAGYYYVEVVRSNGKTCKGKFQKL